VDFINVCGVLSAQKVHARIRRLEFFVKEFSQRVIFILKNEKNHLFLGKVFTRSDKVKKK
jgi:hypothetical protein